MRGHDHAGGSGTDSAALLQLLRVVADAIIEVFLLCIVGYVLARKGIVDDKTKKRLNHLNVSLFTPCLLFSKVAWSLSPDKLAELWVVPIGFCIVTGVSAGVAYVMAKLFRLKKSQAAFAIACSMFGNSNSLPIALMQSLVATVSGLKWGKDDDKDQMLGRALSYLVLFSTLGIILRWSYGVRLLSTADDEEPAQSRSNSALTPSQNVIPIVESENAPLLRRSKSSEDRFIERTESASTIVKTPSPTDLSHKARVSYVDEPESMRDETAEPQMMTGEGKQPPDLRPSSVFHSFPNTRQHTPATSEWGNDDDDDEEDERHRLEGLNSQEEDEDSEWGVSRGVGRRDLPAPASSRLQSRFRKIWSSFKAGTYRWIGSPSMKLGRGIGKFMTVPLWAALLSMVVACIPPLQSLLHDVEPLKGALRSAGNCSVPITLVVLGAYFYRPPADPAQPRRMPIRRRSTAPDLGEGRKAEDQSRFKKIMNRLPLPSASALRQSEAQAPGETRTVMVAILSRMIITPLILLPLLGWWASKTINVADDPVFIVTACLIIGAPPAITLAQMTSAASDAFELLITRTLFVAYAIVTPPTTVLLVIVGLLLDQWQDGVKGGT
ncbi:uncharacterized protein L969DRAFT_73659 [Mixia osmundae IAM 14324]|uniref:Auxin efflux carrier n=1 Tax=Mixia osmundae (strain CBS 9802 / IAM 14324 / JCM 22182 / KY 12970) TaxID=764103 RepID=G7E8U4_MIXOS|nr:uncharacterized protein L969DRAFT_73659 [Mixia osmundae IAM 14324]KEI40198.1 hypothetical protein L969DRAFT_73659 [Mixia osmundae IAM 14324]GAA99562.1 hypothetical protein E5Q_06263 [Mixia osmundae IAM 14324]